MSTEAQIAANQANAQLSTGPRTEEGKARVAHNAVKLGLFSATAFVTPDQHPQYENFVTTYLADLTPQDAVERSLADEVIHAAWRLRRCNDIESRELTGDEDPAELERTQTSVDRARATAQRGYFRSLNELRRVQSERVYRQVAFPKDLQIKAIGQAECRRLDLPGVAERQTQTEIVAKMQRQMAISREIFANALAGKQTQPAPGQVAGEPPTEQTQSAAIPRSAPCPCGSGYKYKRCCGQSAPPMLSRAA